MYLWAQVAACRGELIFLYDENGYIYFVINIAGCSLQALLEMGDVASAQAMVNYFSERPPTIRGRTVYVQFSNHNELKTEQSSQVSGLTVVSAVSLL